MTYRCRALLDMSKGETCVRCGKRCETVVGAHYTGARRGTYGGGLSIKVHDCLVADLCGECHAWMDTKSREKGAKWEHSELFLHFIALTIVKRFENGQLRLAHRSEADVPVSLHNGERT